MDTSHPWDDPAEELRSIAAELELARQETSTAADLLGKQDVLEAKAADGIKLIWGQLFARPHAEMHGEWALKLSDDAFFDSLEPWPSVQRSLCELLGYRLNYGLYQASREDRRAAVAKGEEVAQVLCAIADWLDDQAYMTFDMAADRHVQNGTRTAHEQSMSEETETLRIGVTEATLQKIAASVVVEDEGDFPVVDYNPDDPALERHGKPGHAAALDNPDLKWKEIAVQVGLEPGNADYIRKWSIAWGIHTGQRLRHRKRGRSLPLRSNQGGH